MSQLAGLAGLVVVVAVQAQNLTILGFSPDGRMRWSGAFSAGVCTVETASTPNGAWIPIKNVFTTAGYGSVSIEPPGTASFFRLKALNISSTAQGFTNLCASYSVLHTIAGKGDSTIDGYNGWDPQFEGGAATSAELSRPHIAMADDDGNIYIADKDGQAIRKVTLDGRIVTVAGTNVAGDDGDTPGLGVQRRLSSPNGLWVRGDGTLYILDLDNAKIRRLDTNGVLTTMFRVKDGISTGRGLWVKADESLVYFASGTTLKKWTASGGVKTVSNDFVELGNLFVDSLETLFVTDRGANRVYRVSKSGTKTPIAGNGDTTGGGDGALALETGLAGVRGIWSLPTGGYLLGTHEGGQIWYMDLAGRIHLFVDGARGAHSGDEEPFQMPGFKISEVRAVTMDRQGRIIITENDAGFVRTIDFLPVATAIESLGRTGEFDRELQRQ